MIKLNAKTNKGNVTKLIDMQINSVNSLLSSEKAFSNQILVFLKSFIGNIEVDCIFSDEINKFLSDASHYLSKINSNIAIYNNLLDILDNIKFNCPDLEYSAIVSRITAYNEKFDKATSEVLKSNNEIERFIHEMQTIDISEYISVENMDKIETSVDSQDGSDSDSNLAIAQSPIPEKKPTTRKRKGAVSLVENTLTISEKTGLVTLPYKISDLKKVLRKEPEKYTSLTDVILAQYTIPLRNYKFSAISRFREAYKLIIEKEHGSKKEALNLGAELLANYNLHPAIITACKNLNELDIYLSCLEFNELEDFHFFKIVYEALPVITKTNKNMVTAN